jgi:hypothetical protein
MAKKVVMPPTISVRTLLPRSEILKNLSMCLLLFLTLSMVGRGIAPTV